MTDATDKLAAILAASGARVTFDRERSAAKPCIVCGTTSEPRELVAIGFYTRRMGGDLRPGDKIERPLCANCKAATEPKP